MDDKELADRLQAEYLHLQKVIEDFDGRVITIKAWSVSFSLVAFLGAFAAHKAGALLLASASAALFWFIEAFWKRYQFVYYSRCNEIESFFRGEQIKISPMQIAATWDREWDHRSFKRLLWMLFWPNVFLPHAVILIAGAVLYTLVRSGDVSISQ